MTRSAKDKDVSCSLDLPEEMSHIYVDKDLLRVAINNLLTNAIKYNRPQGKVTLSAEETDDQIIIYVKDTGKGIATDELDKIFEKFYRSSDPEISGITGHGLGLSLAKSIIELHHGRLQVESELQKGSTFSITFGKSDGLIKQGI